MSNVQEYRSVAGIVVFRNPLSQTLESTDALHSLNRKPTEKLYLLVKKPRDDHAWQFPQGGLKKKETLVEGALRELSEECGGSLQVKLVDTEPYCVYSYAFPPEFVKLKKRKKQYPGANVQFVRAEWISGQCQPDGKEIIDFAWLTIAEIETCVSKEYGTGIKHIFE